MKASQKIVVSVEGLTFETSFAKLDVRLLDVARKLEVEGDEFGHVSMLVDVISTQLCVTMGYADKRRGPVKGKLFGYDSDVFLAKQFK